MSNSESIYNKFFPLSVSAGNRLTSDYEMVYKTKLGSSILLTTTGFHPHLAHGAGRVSSPNRTQSTSSGRKSSETYRQ